MTTPPTSSEIAPAEPAAPTTPAWHPFTRECHCADCVDHYAAMRELEVRLAGRQPSKARRR